MLRIKVEGNAGDSIDRVCAEMCALATRLGISVENSFNGTRLLAEPNSDPADLLSAWEVERGQDNRFALAIARSKAA